MQLEAFCSVIAGEVDLKIEQIKKTIELLDAGNTVPFISRYRKELTGGLNEEQIRQIEDRIAYLRNLQARKDTVLESIEKQGKLTPDLRKKITNALKLHEVEDLYLPFRPKKRTRATVAKEKGLQALADLIFLQEINERTIEEIAQPYVNPENEIHTIEEALAGARDIIAEAVSEDADVRKEIRRFTYHTGMIKTKAKKKENLSVYEMYADYSEPVKLIKAHRVLAINRGEREGFLRFGIELVIDKVLENFLL